MDVFKLTKIIYAEGPLKYPLIAYVYGTDGFHGGKVWLNNEPTMKAFLETVGSTAMREKRELMIADMDDHAVFHARRGEIIHPKPQP